MAGRKTLSDLLNDMNDSKAGLEKSAASQDATLAILNELKGKVQTDVNVERLVKQASAVSQTFAEQVMQKLASDEYIEKVAARVVEMLLEKLAIESSEEVITVGSDPVPKDNPMTVVEQMAGASAPASSNKAQSVKEDLLNTEMVEGADVEGSADEEKKASADLDSILAYLLQDQ